MKKELKNPLRIRKVLGSGSLFEEMDLQLMIAEMPAGFSDDDILITPLEFVSLSLPALLLNLHLLQVNDYHVAQVEKVI